VCFLILRNLSEKNSGIKNNNKNRAENILGLAKKAGAIISGTELVIESVRKKRACRVFVCSDASPGTLKKLSDKAGYYKIPVTKLDLTMSELSHCIGLTRLTAAVSLTNKNFLKLFELSELIELTELTGKSTEVHL